MREVLINQPVALEGHEHGFDLWDMGKFFPSGDRFGVHWFADLILGDRSHRSV